MAKATPRRTSARKTATTERTEFKAGFSGYAHRITTFVEQNPIMRLVAMILGLVALASACTAFFQIALDVSNRRDDRLADAWETVTRPVPGNTGKGAAIEHLLAQNFDLVGLDISCARMGGGWDENKHRCANHTVISDIRVAGQSSWVLWNASGVHFIFDDLSNLRFDYVDLRGALFTDTQLNKAIFVAKLNGAEFALASMQDAQIVDPTERQSDALAWAPTDEPQEIYITGSDVSGLRVSAKAVTIDSDHNFAWADRPPMQKVNGKFVPIEKVKLCNPTKVRAGSGGTLENIRSGIRIDAFTMDPVFPQCVEMPIDEAKSAFPKEWKDAEMGWF